MVIRQVPAVGRWSLILGLMLPFFGYALLADYNPSQGFLWNAQVQHIVLPFFHGQNPLNCLADSSRKMVTVPFGWSYKPEPGCTSNTVIPFKTILLTSLGLLLLGVYFYFRKEEIANKWSTDITPMKSDDDNQEPIPKKNVKISYDGPIPPTDGGF